MNAVHETIYFLKKSQCVGKKARTHFPLVRLMRSTHLARLWTHLRCNDEKNRGEPERDQSQVGKYVYI